MAGGDSAGRVADLPRSEAELQALLEQTCSEKKKANEHARRLKLLHFKATKAKKPGQPASVPPAPANLEQEFAALRLKVEEASLDSLQGLLQMLRGTEWPQELQELKEIAEVAERRRQELAEAAQRRQAAAEEAEAELQRLRKSKEALLAAKAACTRSRADRAQEAVEDGESTSATKEQNSNPSSRSSSDVGLRCYTSLISKPTGRNARGWAEDLEPKLGLAGRKKVLQAQAADRSYLQPDGSWGPFHTAQLPRSWRQARERRLKSSRSDPDEKGGSLCPGVMIGSFSGRCSEGAAQVQSEGPKAAVPIAKASPGNGFVNFHWQVIKEDDDPQCGKEFLARLEALKPAECGRPELGSQVPTALMELYWKKREGSQAPRRKKLQMLGISLKRHEHRNQAGSIDLVSVSDLKAICSIKCAILRCDFEVLHIECLSAEPIAVIRTVIKQHENDGQPVSVFAAQNGEEVPKVCEGREIPSRSLRCPIEHRLIYELCKDNRLGFLAGQDGITVADCLCATSLVRLAATNKELYDDLTQHRQRMWHKAVSVALPRFDLSEDLFERPQKFLTYLKGFAKAIALGGEDWSGKATLRLRSLNDSRKLFERLKGAHQVACKHLSTGGSFAKVFLSPLVLPELSSKVRFWMEESDEEGLNQDLVYGQEIEVPASEAPQYAETGRKARSRDTISQARPMRLHFARLNHQLLMAVRDDMAPADIISLPFPDWRPRPLGAMRVTVDVSIADMQHQLFHFKGITMTVNGPWVDCCGLYAAASGRDTFAPDATAKAALCIICLRDDGVERADVPVETFTAAKLPDALHLDSLRSPFEPRF
ncbi:unnamed protein product [Effrenium voratum]|uniref:Uncharacterized protein n=1 Tax=Effrenium voratum TaxID=2562239 RepID=A0AA36IHN8_9DINO|nr:unnamed protein product [Effrenium voratum]